MDKKVLVAYFSASGTTARTAEKLSQAIKADLYEIKPEIPYTKADLNWMDPGSRSSVEMNNPASRPTIGGEPVDMNSYDVIFLGFPIWWYVAPSIIHTFLESYDLTGKTVIPFATSGGSGMGKTNEKLKQSCPGAVLLPGKLLNGVWSEEKLRRWAESLKN